MSAEEEDKKEDKGDHINLKVKDQVRAATRPAQIVQKTRSRSTRHFENIAETSPLPLFAGQLGGSLQGQADHEV
jgi:hypothetical protein|tara:strand:- start:43 stop:264 length:222 start_codon:yes stop_codon:yes gene_type:complete